MTNVNLYSRFLEKVEAVEVTSGPLCGQAGDYLAWGQMKLTMVGQENILQSQVRKVHPTSFLRSTLRSATRAHF